MVIAKPRHLHFSALDAGNENGSPGKTHRYRQGAEMWGMRGLARNRRGGKCWVGGLVLESLPYGHANSNAEFSACAHSKQDGKAPR